MKWTLLDCEGDGLYPTKFHVMSWQNHDEEDVTSTDLYPVMADVLTESPIICGHNLCRWDIPHLERLLDIEIPKETLIVDTLAVAWYLQPKRPRHNLDSYGPDYGYEKPKVDDWENLSYEVYRHRCETDVKINVALWKDQLAYLRRLYGSDEEVVRFLRYLQFKMRCAALAEESGWLLDQELARSTLSRFETLQKEKFDELRIAMPPVPIVATRQRPSVMYKANGDLSVAGSRWRQLLESRGFREDYEGPIDEVTGFDEPNPNSHDQIKRWLFDLGWKPQTFKENKKKEEIPQINKQKQNGGGVCGSIKLLYEKEPKLEALDSLFVLGHRIGILRGLLESVDDSGRVRARIQGLTNTLRFKHAEIVNIPKTDAAFAENIRACLIAPEGEELCGSDLSSLEDKLKQHFIYPHDPRYVNEMNVPGYDPHLDLALTAKKITQKQVDDYKAGVYEPWLKTLRGIWKNGNYSCQFGAFPPKIAKTVGGTLEEGQQIFDAYWKRNWAIKRVAQLTKTKTVNGDNWLYNPISKFWYSLRAEKDKFSTLVQGSGVYCFDTWLGFVLNRRPQLTGQFHDEFILCVKQGYRRECEELIRDAMNDVNEVLNLNVKLGCDVQFGGAYSNIH